MKQAAKILTPGKIGRRHQGLPAVWKKAAGLLRGRKKVNGLKYQRASRQAWQKRLEKLAK